MFFNINAENYRDLHVAAIVKNPAGEIVSVTICPFVQVADLSRDQLAGEKSVMVVVVDQDVDRVKLANRFMMWLGQNGAARLQWSVRDMVASWAHGNRGSGVPVICVETGETWGSLTACAESQGLSYSQLIKHLNGAVGYKKVKGRTYKRAGSK